MPRGVYTRKKGIRSGKKNPMYERKQKQSSKDKMSIANSGEKSGRWIDGRAWISSMHTWVVRKKVKLKIINALIVESKHINGLTKIILTKEF